MYDLFLFTRTFSVQTNNNDVVYRHATEEDIDGITALSRAAHKDSYKWDYLPGWMPKILKDPHRMTSVAEQQGKIVGHNENVDDQNIVY